MIWQLFHYLEFLLWLFFAGSVGYVAFFALASIRRHQQATPKSTSPQTRFLVVYPAYHEDRVIRQSVSTFLQQDYPQELYHLAVVSDHMTQETNDWLAAQRLTLLQPVFEKSSKAKALQYVIQHFKNEKTLAGSFDHIVILDADNVVSPDFLSNLDAVCQQGYRAIQCHRTAKNANNDIAALDGISEEINNSLFRRAHNNIGLSSALIGSGMCFDYEWFCNHVDLLSSAVEDREIETYLALEKIHVRYEENILVMDEKVSASDNFERQRLRWMTGQVQSLFSMTPHLPKAICTGNINYIDKTVQQALIPRSILLVMLPVIAILISILAWTWAIKWWVLFLVLCISLFIAIPRPLRSRALIGKVLALPALSFRMVKNIFHIKKSNTDFLHTTHG